MTCAQGLLRLLWGGARSWSATGLCVFICVCVFLNETLLIYVSLYCIILYCFIFLHTMANALCIEYFYYCELFTTA